MTNLHEMHQDSINRVVDMDSKLLPGMQSRDHSGDEADPN